MDMIKSTQTIKSLFNGHDKAYCIEFNKERLDRFVGRVLKTRKTI